MRGKPVEFNLDAAMPPSPFHALTFFLSCQLEVFAALENTHQSQNKKAKINQRFGTETK